MKRNDNMLEVNGRFIAWFREKIKDESYSERLIKRVTDMQDITIREIWTHTALPFKTDYDPEMMIGMVNGHNNQENTDFITIFFGKYEDLGMMLSHVYLGKIWERYHPVTDTDFAHLPVIYEIAFTDRDSQEELFYLKYECTSEGKVVDEDPVKQFRMNLINTKNDTDLIKTIVGELE